MLFHPIDLQACVYPWEVECNITVTTEASNPTVSDTTPSSTHPPDTPDCIKGPTGKFCDYDVLIPSPGCCDYYRECANNVEYNMPCQDDADGERLWFDEEFQARG